MEKEKKIYSLGKPCKGEIRKIRTVVDYDLEEVVNGNGTIELVNVPFDGSKLDLGQVDMYNLENMLAVGIRPSDINTSSSSRIGAETVINTLADSITITEENN